MENEVSSGFTIENILNKDDNALPFGYFCPEDEKLVWICGEGPAKDDGSPPDIISVFQRGKDKDAKYLKNIEEAKFSRDELVKAGWLKLKPPKIEFTVNGENKPLNRKQKRFLEKKVKDIVSKDY